VGAIQLTLTLGGRKEPRTLDESLDPSRQTYWDKTGGRYTQCYSRDGSARRCDAMQRCINITVDIRALINVHRTLSIGLSLALERLNELL